MRWDLKMGVLLSVWLHWELLSPVISTWIVSYFVQITKKFMSTLRGKSDLVWTCFSSSIKRRWLSITVLQHYIVYLGLVLYQHHTTGAVTWILWNCLLQANTGDNVCQMGLGMLEGAFLDEHGQVGRTLYQHISLSVSLCLLSLYIYVYDIHNI